MMCINNPLSQLNKRNMSRYLWGMIWMCGMIGLSIQITSHTQEKKEVFSKLKAKYESLKELYGQMQKTAEIIDKNIQQYDGEQGIEINILHSGVREQREVFMEIQKVMGEVVGKQECLFITEEEIEELENRITRIQEEEISILGSVESRCLQEQQLSFQQKIMKEEIAGLRKKLANHCQPPRVILPTLYRTVLTTTSSYILANYTLDTYKQQTQALSSAFQIQYCPDDKPFAYDAINCDQCQGLYNLSSKQCLKEGCPTYTYLEDRAKQCLPTTKLAQLTTDKKWVYGKLTPEEYSKKVEQIRTSGFTSTCPTTQPFPSSDKTTCIECSSDEIFNVQTNKCTKCKQDESYTPSTHTCTEKAKLCPEQNAFWNGEACILCKPPGEFIKNKCQCPKPYQYNNQNGKCELHEEKLCESEKQMFWDGSVCISCPSPGKFSQQTLKCECPEQKSYNEEKQICVFGNGVIAYVPNLAATSNWVYGDAGKDAYNSWLASVNSEITTQECPVDAPYLDNHDKCVVCGEGELFDLSTTKCTTCNDGQQLDTITHQCTSANLPQKQCTSELPIWNGTGCIKCEQPGKLTQTKCSCPTDYHYDWQSYTCLQNTVKKISNFINDGWIYGTLTSESYQERLAALSKQYILEKCQTDKPFASNSGECIVCPVEKIYDLSTGFCTICEGGPFNLTAHQCMKDNTENVVCPKQLPFFNGTTCIKCESPGVFEEGKCVCPDLMFFNAETEICEPIPTDLKNSNPTAVNYAGQQPSSTSLLETCPSSTPFFNGNSCIACESPYYFDYASNSCKVCEDKFTFDVSSRTCILVAPDSTTVKYSSLLDQVSNYCCQPGTTDIGLQSCPPQKPYFDNKQCVQCEIPLYFNLTKAECEECEKGLMFSLIKKECIQPKYLTLIYKSNLDENKNYIGQPRVISSLYEKVEKCPTQNPYFDGLECVSCALPSYWNFHVMACEICPPGMQFSTDNQVCFVKTLLTDYLNSNLVDAENFANRVPPYNPNYETCPSTTPYYSYSSESCISCQLPQYFDMITSMCESCPEGFIFDTLTQFCERSEQHFVTDPKTSNLYFNGDFGEVIEMVGKKVQVDPSIQYCSSDTPFYQSRTDTCISCPSETPLFNIKYGECTSCSNGSYFSSEKHVCVSTGAVQPTVQRMIMNIINFI